MKNGKYTLSGYITRLAVLLALVIVLQIFGSYIRIGAVNISLVLIPIVFGGMLLGPLAGTFLGFAFGAVTLIAGITGADGFTNILFTEHPFWTAVICIGKATAAGFIPSVIYKALAKKNVTAATFVASAAAPIINTGLFIVGVLLFVADTVTENFANGTSLIYYLVIVCAGINFIVEFLLNLFLTPALIRVERIIGKSEKTPEKTDNDEEEK